MRFHLLSDQGSKQPKFQEFARNSDFLERKRSASAWVQPLREFFGCQFGPDDLATVDRGSHENKILGELYRV